MASKTSFNPQALLRQLKALPRPSGYRVGFSGGMDSMVLLHALAACRGELQLPLSALHVDHGLQAESAAWSEFCETVCRRLHIPFSLHCLQLRPQAGESLEALAREARLRAFSDSLAPGEMLLAAQHADDQAETLMLQLLRGSGPEGLAAMPKLNSLGGGYLVRPLLDFTREQLLNYAREQALEWIDDPSNQDLDFDRNYLRHRVMPNLRERWPSMAHTLSRSARHCAEAAELILDGAVDKLHGVRGSLPGSLSIRALTKQPACWQPSLLRRWIDRQGCERPDSRHLQRVLDELLPAAAGRRPLVAWSGVEVRRYRDDIFVMPALPRTPEANLAWPEDAEVLELPAGLGRLQLKTGIDCKGLRVGFNAPGCSCRRGIQGRNKPLKKLYQEAGVPDWLRPLIPLLFAGERLLAVADLWGCGDEGNSPLIWSGHEFGAFLPSPS